MANRNYTIVTDTTCDLPQDYYEKNNVTVIALTYMLGGVEYDGSFENSLKPALFYEKLRGGIMAKTAAVSPETMTRIFTNVLEQGDDLLYIAFSSGLSSTYQNACIARDELAEKYPDQKILCVDSLCASLGEGLLLDLVLRKSKRGCGRRRTGRLCGGDPAACVPLFHGGRFKPSLPRRPRLQNHGAFRNHAWHQAGYACR